jgi:hypothetical protein
MRLGGGPAGCTHAKCSRMRGALRRRSHTLERRAGMPLNLKKKSKTNKPHRRCSPRPAVAITTSSIATAGRGLCAGGIAWDTGRI